MLKQDWPISNERRTFREDSLSIVRSLSDVIAKEDISIRLYNREQEKALLNDLEIALQCLLNEVLSDTQSNAIQSHLWQSWEF